MTRKGIDVSTHQGIIDWAAVKAAGIEFAIIRAGYGKNNIDKQFKRNIGECNRLGIPCGVYWFSYALTVEDARREAEYCIAAVKPYKLDYPVVFDLEYDTVRYAKDNGVTITKALATQMVMAFCSRVEELGYYAANYMNSDYSKNMFDMGQLSRFDLWYAWYNSSCNRSDAGLWQYTNSGKVSGIAGKVDMNTAFKDYPAIIQAAGLNGLTPEKEENPMSKDEIKALIREVLDEMNPIYKDVKDVPSYWREQAQAMLDAGAINGGTPAEENPTDMNIRKETLKAAIIATAYHDAKSQQ